MRLEIDKKGIILSTKPGGIRQNTALQHRVSRGNPWSVSPQTLPFIKSALKSFSERLLVSL